MSCDLVLLGVGGQGVLTLADLLIRTAFAADLAATYCPTKGMAQRGGFVKAEVRLGSDRVGPRIGEGCADVVVALERSESLRGVPFIKPSGAFVLFDHVWAPADVMLGAAPYPSRDDVVELLEGLVDRLVLLLPEGVPAIDGQPARPNLFVLGATVSATPLGDLLSADRIEETIAGRWPKVADANLAAFRAGMEAL